MSAELLEMWRRAGRPTGLWSAKAANAVEGVRLGEAETDPVEFELLRTFSPAGPSRFGRLRLLRVRVAPPLALGWSEVFLLGGEVGMAGTTSQVSIPIGDGVNQNFGVLFTATAIAAILPMESRLSALSDQVLTDLYHSILRDHFDVRDKARKNVKVHFHHEDELASVTVVAREDGGELRLAFGLDVDEEGAAWLFETERVPPSLKHLLTGSTAVEPGIPTQDVGRLLVVASALASGDLGEIRGLGWEGALCPHAPRRLFTVETPAGTVAFGVRMDDAAKRPLREILEAKRAQRAR